MASKSDSEPSTAPTKRNGRLRIPLPFEEALAAAVEVKPDEKPAKKPKPKKKKKAAR